MFRLKTLPDIHLFKLRKNLSQVTSLKNMQALHFIIHHHHINPQVIKLRTWRKRVPWNKYSRQKDKQQLRTFTMRQWWVQEWTHPKVKVGFMPTIQHKYSCPYRAAAWNTHQVHQAIIHRQFKHNQNITLTRTSYINNKLHSMVTTLWWIAAFLKPLGINQASNSHFNLQFTVFIIATIRTAPLSKISFEIEVVLRIRDKTVIFLF